MSRSALLFRSAPRHSAELPPEPPWFWVRAALKIAFWLQRAENSRTLMQAIDNAYLWCPCRAHHPVRANRTFSRRVQLGRLCPVFPTCFGALQSLRPHAVSGGTFGGPVSAPENPVPGGQGSADICLASRASTLVVVATLWWCVRGVRY